MATPARLAPPVAVPVAPPTVGASAAPTRPELAEVPDLAWTAGEWVEVERVHLAPVIALDDYRAESGAGSSGLDRNRAAAWLGAIAVALLLALTAGGQLADAGPVDQVAGQAVVEPGQTLWDVAVAHAPADVDPRLYLAQLRELNDLTTGTVPAWTVVLLPHG